VANVIIVNHRADFPLLNRFKVAIVCATTSEQDAFKAEKSDLAQPLARVAGQ